MPNVCITGWSHGCETVSAIKAIREVGSIGLKEALDLVNRVIEGETMNLQVATLADAELLATTLSKLGLIVTMSNE